MIGPPISQAGYAQRMILFVCLFVIFFVWKQKQEMEMIIISRHYFLSFNHSP